MKKIFILIIFVIISWSSNCNISDAQMIDIGLKFGSSLKSVKISSEGLIAKNDNEQLQISNSREYIVIAEEDGSIGIYDISGEKIYSFAGDSNITLGSADNHLISVFNKRYRGELRFINKNGNLTVINRLDIEDYLYGVIPSEMIPSWEEEALKAQAVAARSYAIKNMSKYASYGFNLTDDTRSQAYGGFDVETQRTNLAVDYTAGIVGYYGGEVAELIYGASSGGATLSAENIWGSDIPYLIDKKDTYSIGTPYDNWSFDISREEIEKAILNTGKNIGNLKDIQIGSTSKYGHILEINFIGKDGIATYKGDKIRGIFGNNKIKSLLFKISPLNASVSPKDDLVVKSGSFGILNSFVRDKFEINNFQEKINSTQYYTVKGSGYGHGVGMSQWGAQNMAKSGKNFVEILEFYYPGVDIR